ncbi:PAS domain-containing sensor histidine kinase [Halobellus litoreus]|uniref:histidine kinase n=1 Tax=Halobellus litoreus TaxID=755310 RepID=A0ABD6DP71_9EURY|nr:PAS domain-containing sensor histidine kinase [Halobellus litoreus]
MSDRSGSPAVVVLDDDALASAVRSAVADASTTMTVLSTTADEYAHAIDRGPVDCVVARQFPPPEALRALARPAGSPVFDSGPEPAADAESGSGSRVLPSGEPSDLTVPLVLYPSTPTAELARRSADAEAVRYVPQSIDTGDYALLVDAIEGAVGRRAQERELRAHAAERDLLVQMSSLADVGGWELDADGEALTWTAETRRLHGVSEAFEPTVDNAIEFYHPDDRESVRADVEAALGGDPFDSTYRLYRADGDVRWVRSKGVPIVEDESIVGVRGSFQDVTAEKRREDDIRQFKQAVEAAGHAIFITQRNGTIEYVNPAFEAVTGYEAEEAVGRDPSILKSGQMDQEYYRNLWSTVLDGEVWSEPIVNRRKSGEHYHASETIAPITTDDGAIQGFVAIQTDITDRVHARERLETFREMVNRLDDPIMLQNRDGSFEVVNDAVAEYAGLSRSELIGDDEFAFMDEPAARTIREHKDRVLELERSISYEVTPTFPTKGERSFATTRYPHYDEEGAVDGSVAICRDITEQSEREHQLRVLDRILRHNLYNKMNLILGHAELLENRTTGDAKSSVQQIIETGDDLVELADKERRIVELLTDDSPPRRIDIRELLEDVAAELRESHPEASIVVDCPESFDVRAIPEVRKALTELLRNAVVHTGDDPAVSVRVTRADGTVAVAVADDGPGIPEMERKAARSETDITPLFHGSGLGLQFVNHVARRSGGSLRFGSSDHRTADPDLRPATTGGEAVAGTDAEKPGGGSASVSEAADADSETAASAAADGTGGAVVVLYLPAADESADEQGERLGA